MKLYKVILQMIINANNESDAINDFSKIGIDDYRDYLIIEDVTKEQALLNIINDYEEQLSNAPGDVEIIRLLEEAQFNYGEFMWVKNNS